MTFVIDKSLATPIYTPESIAAWKKETESTKESFTGAMLALMIPSGTAEEIALSCPGALDPGDLHITLVFLGDTTNLGSADRAKIEAAVKETASQWAPISGDIGGVGIFFQDDVDVLYQSFDGVGLPGMRQELVNRLKLHQFTPPENHGFTPHITLAYTPKGITLEDWGKKISGITFGGIWLCWGNERVSYPFTGTRLKHLMGRHDQKRHGWRGSSSLDKSSRDFLNRTMQEVKERGLTSEQIRGQIKHAKYERSDMERRIQNDGSEVDAVLIRKVKEYETEIKALNVAHELVTAQEHRQAISKNPPRIRMEGPTRPPEFTGIKAGIAKKYIGDSLDKLQQTRRTYMKQRREAMKAGKTDLVHLIDQEFPVLDAYIDFRKELGRSTSKHFQGRHDQKRHGNRFGVSRAEAIRTATAAVTQQYANEGLDPAGGWSHLPLKKAIREEIKKTLAERTPKVKPEPEKPKPPEPEAKGLKPFKAADADAQGIAETWNKLWQSDPKELANWERMTGKPYQPPKTPKKRKEALETLANSFRNAYLPMAEREGAYPVFGIGGKHFITHKNEVMNFEQIQKYMRDIIDQGGKVHVIETAAGKK